MNDEQKIELIESFYEGASYAELAKKYGCTRQYIYQIVLKCIGKDEISRMKHFRMSQRAVRQEQSKDPVKESNRAIRRLVLAKKRWSYHSEACLGCGSTTIEHSRKGYCRNCSYKFVPGVKESRKLSTKKYNAANPEKKRVRDRRLMKNYYARIKADPEKQRTFLDKIKQSRIKRLGGEEKAKEYYRDVSRKRAEKVKEMTVIEKQLKIIDPNYEMPELKKLRQQAHESYYRNREKRKVRQKAYYLRKKNEKLNLTI